MNALLASESVLVACLCAQWCSVCRDYRRCFEQVRTEVQAERPQVQFLWIDVEDEADLLEPLDVDDFPTLLLATGPDARFFGPLIPQAEMLNRMIRSQVQHRAASELNQPEMTALVARIRAAYPSLNRVSPTQ